MKQSTRFSLATLPTPLERMPRLGLALGGCELWIKRDDQTGLAMGGNKARKLEFLIAEALAQGANVILTVGAVQSNHCRQTAAAAAKAGLECILVLPGQMPPADQWTGNLLLDDLLGARIWWAGGEEPLVALEAAAQAERRAGCRPYVISYGGSNAIGASAYARAFVELMDQIAEQGAPRFDRILFASGSGGTQAGLIVGARACGYVGQLVGISVGKAAGDLRDVVTGLLAPTSAHLGLELNFGPDDVQIEDGYVGAGYGLVTDAEREAIRVVASTEGILLDPVYTAKAMAALFDLIRRDKLRPGETALFWHTGGAPALFAYHTDLHF